MKKEFIHIDVQANFSYSPEVMPVEDAHKEMVRLAEFLRKRNLQGKITEVHSPRPLWPPHCSLEKDIK